MTVQPIKIDSGSITVPVQVDDNPAVSITFNPSDKLFAERLHSFYFEIKAKLAELSAKQAEQAKAETDENGMPVDVAALMGEYDEINRWLREKIDTLLGEGTAQAIYGDTFYTGSRVDVYFQLLDGLFKLVGPARAEKVKKYVKKR